MPKKAGGEIGGDFFPSEIYPGLYINYNTFQSLFGGTTMGRESQQQCGSSEYTTRSRTTRR